MQRIIILLNAILRYNKGIGVIRVISRFRVLVVMCYFWGYLKIRNFSKTPKFEISPRPQNFIGVERAYGNISYIEIVKFSG